MKTLLDRLVAGATGGPVSGPAARRAARTELAKREYRTDTSANPVSRVLNWISRRIGDVMSSSGGNHAFLLLGLLLLVVAIFAVVRAGMPSRTPADHDHTDPLAPVAASDHRRLAAQHQAQGNRREALREWLRAAIATIEERGILPPRPGRTGAATAREAGPLVPVASNDLSAATIAFDEVWFGGRAATDADVDQARAAADGVMRAPIAIATTGAVPDGLAIPW